MKYENCSSCEKEKPSNKSSLCRACYFENRRTLKVYEACVDCGKEKKGRDTQQRSPRCRPCMYENVKKQNTKKFDHCQVCGKEKSRTYNQKCRSCSQKGIVASEETRRIWSEQRTGKDPWNKGKKTGKRGPWSWEVRAKISNVKTGLNRTEEEYKDYVSRNKEEGRRRIEGKSYASRQWSKAIKERDNYTCQSCGSRRNLHAHHILPWASHPDKREDLSNGICVCEGCHKEIHKKVKN